jgi:hypothetical protein
MPAARRTRVAVAIGSVLVLLLGGGLFVALHSSGPHLTPAELAAQAERARLHRELVAEERAARRSERLVVARLPTHLGAAAPTATAPLFTSPLASHHVVGYVPYWEVASVTSLDLSSASELVYSSVCPAASGQIATATEDCALGLADLSGSAFASMTTDAHADGDRVLLSVETTDNALIEQLDAHAAQSAPALAASLVALERAHDLDGTNIDVEGSNPADREGFVRFVAALTAALRSDDPGGEILLDTYADAAAGKDSFFDPKRLAPLVDALFVMNYSLESTSVASANSPLESPDLGYSAVQSLIEYERIVPAHKIIFGVPFYGYDFTTVSGRPGARTATADPTAQTYSAIVGAAYPPLWDPATETPFSKFQRAGAWHQLWFDDPVSIALKVALAAQFHTAGVGAWAFGMENGDPLMLAALTGGRAPMRTSLASSAG